MHSILIRNVPPNTLRALKRLARSHHRSLQGELRVILDRAAELAPAGDIAGSLELVTVKTKGSTSWSREEIYGDDGR
ncbi:MAG: hypothetical protein OXH27_01595 [Gammaproteobacteria bacterium]|nr:hypothetical protein [Gammaproteobacteria bacterium]MCY3690180.1 hypothetical protein [Gammaproteobacteria bacterium]